MAPTNRSKLPVMSALHTMKCFVSDLVNLSRISSSPFNQTNTDTVLFDSGANCCVTNAKSDFTEDFSTEVTNRVVDGIGKGLKIEGSGTVAWTFVADNGMYRTLRLPCYYIPTANTQIALLQRILEAYPKETFSMNQDSLTLSGHNNVPPVTLITRS